MNMAVRPVQRIKHVVDSNGLLTAGSNLEIALVEQDETPTLADTNAVITGAKVNGIYLKVEVVSNETDAGAIPNAYLAVYKNTTGLASTIGPNAVGSNANKKLVIHQEMVMLNNVQGGNPRILFNGVIVIPKGMRRFGPSDELICVIRSNALNIAYCLQCHYKEFR